MKVKRIEKLGIIFIFIMACILHSAYTLTDISWLKAFCPVNESVWEHMKMMYFSGLIFIFIEIALGFHTNKNFFVAKAFSQYILAFCVPMLFYTYTNLLGSHNLIFDISISGIGAIFSQWVSFKILLNKKICPKWTSLLSITLILILGGLFVIFSYVPPTTPIFIPPN